MFDPHRRLLPHLWNITFTHIIKTLLIQSKELNGDLKPKHNKTTNRSTMSSTTDSQAPTTWNRLRGNRCLVWGQTYRCAIKEGSKVINHNWVNNHPCSKATLQKFIKHNTYTLFSRLFLLNTIHINIKIPIRISPPTAAHTPMAIFSSVVNVAENEYMIWVSQKKTVTHSCRVDSAK